MNNHSVFEHFLRIFCSLSVKEIEQLTSDSKLVKLEKNELLFREGTPLTHFFFVVDGLIKLYKERQNKKVILDLINKQQFIPYFSLFSSPSYQVSAKALSTTMVFYINKQRFINITRNNTLFLQYLHKIQNVKGEFLYDRFINLYQKQLPGRVADVLLFLADEIYHAEHFQLHMSRQELAEFAGTTKESLIRTLTEFKTDRIIDINVKEIKINSAEVLKKLSKYG